MKRWPIWGLFVLVLSQAAVAGSVSVLHNQPPYPSSKRLSLLHPQERLSYSSDWRRQTVRTPPRGGHVFVILNLGQRRCDRLSSSIEQVRYYSFYPSYLSTASDDSGRPGWFYDVLVPRNAISCQLSPFVLAEWRPRQPGSQWFQRGDAGAEHQPEHQSEHRVEVQLRFDGDVSVPRKAFHIGLSNSFLIQGHCLSYCPLETELGNAYQALLRAHHLSPYHQWIRVPPIVAGRLDLDAGAALGQSFRQQVMAGQPDRIAFPRVSGQPQPEAYLRALEATVKAEKLIGKAWVYVRDEPQDMAALKLELARYRRYAPSLLTLVTTPWHAALDQQIDIFAPLIQQLGERRSNPHRGNPYRGNPSLSNPYRAKQLWPYTSCMGSCGPNRRFNDPASRNPGPATGWPDLLIDRPAASIRQYFKRLSTLRADATLYYHAVEGYPLYRQGILLRDDPWNFGGNGDGLLLYPGRPGELGLTQHQPLPSLRLKLIRQAIERGWNY